MEGAHYLTQDGRKLHKSETNLHHLFWRRDWYKTPAERKFRQMGGAIVRTTIGEHKDLHANVEPPHKPNPNLMRDIYLFAKNTEYVDSYDLTTQIFGYTSLVAELSRNEQNREDANLLLENFIEQAYYLERGKLEFVRERHGEG